MFLTVNSMRFLIRLLLILIFVVTAAGLVALPFLGQPGLANPKTAGVVGLWINFIGTLHPVFLHLPIGALLLLVTPTRRTSAESGSCSGACYAMRAS